jgi:TolB protein
MKLLGIFFSLLISLSLFAQSDLSIVAVGDANIAKDKIVFKYSANGAAASDASSLRSIQQIIENDFSYYSDKFEIGRTGNGRYQVSITFVKTASMTFQTRVDIKDSLNPSNIIPSETLNITTLKAKLRTSAHEVADKVYSSITRKKSIFLSKIIFVSDRGSTKRRPIKELYQMDFDGGNIFQLTRHRGTVISPAISYSGKKVLYSLITGGKTKRNVNLYVYDLATGKSSLISKRGGINSGAVFMPGDREILLTLSHKGNAEIYAMNLSSKSLRQVTKHYTPDVDPSINFTGDKMAFLSARPGKPMIYIADPRGTERSVKRVSFVGQFNATPRFSPDGREIAFSSWLDNRFDIFRIDHDGGNLVRLTKDFGSNEDPTYSNDGQFIAFSSQRVISRSKAVQNIYIMTREGRILKSITNNFGNCITPRWSK